MEKNVSKKMKPGLIAGILVFLVVAVLAYGYTRYNNSERISKEQRPDMLVDTEEMDIKVIDMQGHWKDEDRREDFVLETVKEFEIKHPDIKVNIKWNKEFPGGREGALQATIDQIKSGDIEWDIIWLEPFYYQQIANALGDQEWAKNHLVDFETVPGFKETQKPFILSDPQFRNHMSGVITGPHMEGFYQPFYYNKVLADKIGLKIKEKGMTFDDLLSYFRQVDDYNRENGTDIPILYDAGDAKGGIGYGPSTWNIFQSLFRSEFSDLEEIKNTDPSPEKMAAVRKVLGSLEELGKFKPLIKDYEGLDWFGTRYYILEEEAVFTGAGASWMYTHWMGIDKKKTMNMVPVEMPAYRPVDHYMGGYNPMFAVMNDSPLRDEAVQLLMAFSTPNIAEKWIRYAKGPSGIKGNISESGSEDESADQYDRFISYITQKYGSNVFDSKTVDYVLGKKYKNITMKFCQHLVAVINGKITADEAYSRILEDMKSEDVNWAG